MDIKNEQLKQVQSIQIPIKEVIASEFLQASKMDKGDEYFQGFNFGIMILYGQYLLAYNEIKRVLHLCRQIDEKSYKTIHKGSPYYWFGMAAFLLRDFETAVYFMDAAVSEDLRLDPPHYPTPATMFIELTGAPNNQAAKALVKVAEEKMNSLISVYNIFEIQKNPVQQLSIERIRELFLSKAVDTIEQKWQSLATTFISFILEYDQRVNQLNLVVRPSSKEPFLLHLFKGCVLLESLLKENPRIPQKKRMLTLGKLLKNLYLKLGLPGNPDISANRFQEVIDLIPSTNKTINNAFMISGKTRNTVGHFLGWEIEITIEQYQRLYEMIGVACLHTISKLYGL
jgi:hypothetical protein